MTDDAEAIEEPANSGRWITLLMMCLVSLFNYMDRMLLAVMSQPIKLEFNLTDTELGLLSGVAFAALYGVMGFPMGRLADRRSRKHVIAGCLACWSAMTMLTGLTASFLQLVLARMFVAVGEAGCNPAGYSLLADRFVARKRNLAMSLFMAGGMAGVIAGFALGGWLSEAYGWRLAFFILGMPGLLLALAILLWVDEPRRGVLDDEAVQSVPSAQAALKLLFGNRAFLFLVLGNSTIAISFFGITQWMPQFFIRSHGMSVGEVGWLFGFAFGVGMVVGTIFGGLVGTRLGRRSVASPLYFCAAIGLAIVPLYICALLTSSTKLAAVCVFAAAAVYAGHIGPSAAATQNLVPVGVRSTAAAIVLLMIATIGIGLGPLVIGVLSDLGASAYGLDSLRYALIASQVFNVVAMLSFLRSGQHAKLQERGKAAHVQS